jgi:hypothetical protein
MNSFPQIPQMDADFSSAAKTAGTSFLSLLCLLAVNPSA